MNSFRNFIDALNPNKSKAKASTPRTKNPWRAVSIKPRSINPCKKVHTISEIRFLIDEAPTLPLEGCNKIDDCRCYYVRHSDRRSDEIRRDIDLGISRYTYVKQERRRGDGGRRTGDILPN